MESHEMSYLESGPERAPSAEPTDQSSLLNSPSDLSALSLPCSEPNSRSRFASIEQFKLWFPEVDPKSVLEQNFLKRLSDRDAAFLVHQVVALTVFLFNLVFASFAIHKNGFNSTGGDLFNRNDTTTCADVRLYNKLLHFIINALSAILLGSSNYCAQILVAPTREDIDKAHDKREWYDIGVQSLRNLRKIDFKRKTLWWCLMLSSALLHLIWNSVIFAAVPINPYNVAVVTQDFYLDQNPWDYALPRLQHLREIAKTSEATPINNSECVERYGGRDAGLTDLIVVASNLTMEDQQSLAIDNTSSLLSNFTTPARTDDWYKARDWLCSAWGNGVRIQVWCTDQWLGPRAKDWTYHEGALTRSNDAKHFWAKVDHCIPAGDAHNMDKKCALRVSTITLAAVCILNLVKCVCICWAAHIHRQTGKATNPHHSSYRRAFALLVPWARTRTPFTRISEELQSPAKRGPEYLVTIGDAIASFLEVEDQSTIDLPVVEREDFTGGWPEDSTTAKEPRPMRWHCAASKRRWIATISMYIFFLFISGYFLSEAIKARRTKWNLGSFSSIWSHGLGDASTSAIVLPNLRRKISISQTTNFFITLLIANIFQVVVSGLYLLYNNLLTTLLVAEEWNDFILQRQTLRLSSPRGIQRSTYFLSLRYAYGIPLMVISGVFHWMISQSIFIIQTIGYSQPGLETPEKLDFERAPIFDNSVNGYSTLGIIISISIGVTMVILILGLGRSKKYKAKRLEDGTEVYPMPLVATCSAAISAACHRHKEDVDARFLPLTWGFVTDVPTDKLSSGRFCFTTAMDVRYPHFLEVYPDKTETSSIL